MLDMTCSARTSRRSASPTPTNGRFRAASNLFCPSRVRQQNALRGPRPRVTRRPALLRRGRRAADRGALQGGGGEDTHPSGSLRQGAQEVLPYRVRHLSAVRRVAAATARRSRLRVDGHTLPGQVVVWAHDGRCRIWPSTSSLLSRAARGRLVMSCGEPGVPCLGEARRDPAPHDWMKRLERKRGSVTKSPYTPTPLTPRAQT